MFVDVGHKHYEVYQDFVFIIRLCYEVKSCTERSRHLPFPVTFSYQYTNFTKTRLQVVTCQTFSQSIQKVQYTKSPIHASQSSNLLCSRFRGTTRRIRYFTSASAQRTTALMTYITHVTHNTRGATHEHVTLHSTFLIRYEYYVIPLDVHSIEVMTFRQYVIKPREQLTSCGNVKDFVIYQRRQ